MCGFDVIRFVDLDESMASHLKCCICLGIFRDPVETECEHTFCSDCIQRSLKLNNSCPQCRQLLVTDRYRRSWSGIEPKLRSNRLVRNIINELRFQCFSDTNGCQQIFRLGSLLSHLEVCEQYVCTRCGLKMGKCEEHNCVDLLKHQLKRVNKELFECIEERNQYKQKYSESVNQNSKLEEVIEKFKTKNKNKNCENREFDSDYENVLKELDSNGNKGAKSENSFIRLQLMDDSIARKQKSIHPIVIQMKIDTKFKVLSEFLCERIGCKNVFLSLDIKCSEWTTLVSNSSDSPRKLDLKNDDIIRYSYN